MNSEIMISLISFAGSALGVLAGVIGANKLTEFRLDKIEGKVDILDSKIEVKVDDLDKKIDNFTDLSIRLSVIETRINDIEKRSGK